MTPRQAQVLEFLERWFDTHAHGPSFDEIMVALGVRSRGHIHALLSALEGQGRIIRRKGNSRSIRLMDGATAAPDLSGVELGRINDRAVLLMFDSDDIRDHAIAALRGLGVRG